MEYCGQNHFKLTGFQGNYQCLMNTLGSVVTLSLVLIISIPHIYRSRRLSEEGNKTHLLHKLTLTSVSDLGRLLILLNGLMPLLAILKLIVEMSGKYPYSKYHAISGIQILSLIEELTVWPVICILILNDRKMGAANCKVGRNRRGGFGLVIIWGWLFIKQNLILFNMWSYDWTLLKNSPNQFSIFVSQYISRGIIFVLGLAILKDKGNRSEIDDNDGSVLLGKDKSRRLSYGTNPKQPSSSAQDSYLVKLRSLIPFLWPRKNILFQFSAAICLVSFVIGRIANTFVPIYSKYIVDSMAVTNLNQTEVVSNSSIYIQNSTNRIHGTKIGQHHITFRWDFILIYVLLKVIQGGVGGNGGLLSSITSILYLNIQQHTARGIEIKFFENLHQLGVRWHLSRKTGEVLRAWDRGTESFNNLLTYIIFNILPTFFDVIVAIVYFTTAFSAIFGSIVFVTIGIYLLATFWMTEWRSKVNREKNLVDNQLKQLSLDCLLNYETIKNYANEDFEKERYLDVFLKYQKQEWIYNLSLYLNDMVQVVIINIGLLTGSLLCVKMVTNGDLSVGDYVLFASYLIQLFEPLNNFGKYYKYIQRFFIDIENMLDVMREELEIKDDPGAPALEVTDGAIEFRNVNFSYIPEKQILKEVSFYVPPGTSLALVGPSGSGKTTITRLLLRFYDLQSGEIFVDGQNVKRVTQHSLRTAIGIVPQDTILFNDSIRYNLKYGRVIANDEEMFEAADLACIDGKIKTFPKGYETMVGERGLKLSGGEKQRVAIARTVLKNPAIVLLDEATSSLDTHTERQIQSSLQSLCEKRTSIIVAHRLSTIANADQILVLKDGSIVERGTHECLLEIGGLYAGMWNDQLKQQYDDE